MHSFILTVEAFRGWGGSEAWGWCSTDTAREQGRHVRRSSGCKGVPASLLQGQIWHSSNRMPVISDNSLVCLLSHFSCVRLFVTPWTVAHQAPLSMEFSRQEYWSGLPCPPPGDLPNAGSEPRSPALQADNLPLSHQGSPHKYITNSFILFPIDSHLGSFHF